MGTLFAIQEDGSWYNYITNFKTPEGNTKKTLFGQHQQLRKGTKTITINNELFLIDWSKLKPRR